MTDHEYQFRLLSVTTLARLGEIRPQDVVGNWTRRSLGGGSFELTIPLSILGSDGALLYPPATLALHRLVEIIRDGEREFVGVIEKRTIDPLAKTWMISGPDLTQFWLSQRIVGATTAETGSGAAETTVKTFVDNHLGTGGSNPAARQAAHYLSVPFSIEADAGYGGTVSVKAQRKSLFQLVQELCDVGAGDLLPEVVITTDYAGYEFRITRPTDRTQSSGSAPFSVTAANVERIKYIEDASELKTFLYVGGDGSGDSRNVTEVEDTTLVGTHMRREFVEDAPWATTEDQRTDYGTLSLAQRARRLVSIDAKPYRASATAEYRDDWDVGDDVSFSAPELREESIDIRVVAARIDLRPGAAEDVSFELGEHRADSVVRPMVEAINRMKAAANVG